MTGLKYHIQRVHKQDIVCAGCNKTFGCDKDLLFHKKRKRDCPEYNPDLQYVKEVKDSKNLVKNETFEAAEMFKTFETKIFKSESLEENVDVMDNGEESINCWGCHKVTQRVSINFIIYNL